ncbi:MAG TPA: hypothetical protein VNJ03_01665 [Vicinamibacterales bacterium]|nr:hypothetical protein [Vicinamibacterales bacterium]
MLSAQRSRAEQAQTLELRFAPLLAGTGTVNRVAAEPVWMDLERSTARAIVRGDRGEVRLEFGLVRERGLWKIETLPRLP